MISMMKILKKISSWFKDPTAVYLTPKVKKKKRRMRAVSLGTYSAFSVLYLTQIFLVTIHRYGLFKPGDVKNKFTGWVLFVMIIVVFFAGKSVFRALRKFSDNNGSNWIAQAFSVVPIIIILLFLYLIRTGIEDAIYIFGHILLARLIWSPIHVLYLQSVKRYDLFNRNIDKYIENKSQEEFKEEFYS